jgi:rRNA maturation protein Nop10
MNKKDWMGVPIEKIQAWQIAFDAEQNNFTVKAACPVCGKNALH